MAVLNGYPALGASHVFTVIVRDPATAVPTAPAAAPSYTMYDSSFAAMANGTGTMSLVTSAVTGWYYASHDVLAGDGYARGSQYFTRVEYAIGSTTYADDQTFKVA